MPDGDQPVKRINRGDRLYELRYPGCKSGAVQFDAHAGFAVCLDCSMTSQACGPEPYYQLIEEETHAKDQRDPTRPT